MSHDERDVETVAEALIAEGAAPGSSLHSWRCEHPAQYGECDCVAETARAVLDALDLPGRERRAKAEALLQAADAWRAMQTHRPPDSAPDTIEGWLMMRSTRVGSEEGDRE